MVTLMALLTSITAFFGGPPVVCNVKADPGVDGYVYLKTGPVHLRPEHCVALSRRVETRKRAYSALVLAHELGHYTLNTEDEQRAECWGLAHVKAIARLLGWNPDKTYRDARYWTFCGD